MEIQTSTITKDAEKFLQTKKNSPNAYVVLLGLKVFDVTGLLKTVEKGLPWTAFTRFMRNSGLSPEQVAELVDIPRRTLARRKAEGRFHADESDRLLRAARVYSRALDLYAGDREAAADWFTYPNWALGRVSPLQFARTGIGAEYVENLVGQIEHGIFS